MIKRLFCLAFCVGTAQAMVFDNRFLPLYLKRFARRSDTASYVRFQPFFMQADRAVSQTSKLNIPDIDGKYDSIQVANALEAIGFENPLRSDFRSRTALDWSRRGRLNVQGLAFLYEQYLWCDPCGLYGSFGIDALFAHVSSRHEFFFDRTLEQQISPGDKEYLLSVKEKMHNELCVTAPCYNHTGFGDLDLYLRFGGRWDYLFKVRRLETAVKFGLLAPTASRTPLNNPAAVPLGGEKHWGAYLEFDNEIELKEDFIVGYMFRASKRFPKTHATRMPVAGEPSAYGALVAPLQVDPGWTFIFNPYFVLDGLREGFGLTAQYTLVAHLKDQLTDKRAPVDQLALPAMLGPVFARSSWGMEHVTLGAFYDFGNIRDCGRFYPKISAYWDIPVDWLVSKRAAKTNSVSLMLELDF